MKDTVHLIKVEASVNNNKYYNMKDNGDGTFTATWGRVGTPGQSKVYDMYEWNKKYNEKTKKGYKDHSNDRKVMSSYKPEVDPIVHSMLEYFLNVSRHYTSKYTEINALNVTSINIVQNYINELTNIKSVMCGKENYELYLKNSNLQDTTDIATRYNRDVLKKFNGILTKIFEIIPRVMKHVEDSFLKVDVRRDSANLEIDKIITREQSLLDNIAIQSKATPTGNETISEAFHFKFVKASQEEFDFIKEKFKKDIKGESIGYDVAQVYVISNPVRDAEFEDYLQNNDLGKNNKSNKNIKLYWHGTGEENILSILSNGFMIRPSNTSYTGSAFGDGIYSAPSPAKANYYAKVSHNTKYMFVNAVITGNSFDCNDNYDRIGNIRICDLDGNSFSQLNLNYHSVHAHATSSSYIRRDEVIVYNSSQVAARYLVVLK